MPEIKSTYEELQKQVKELESELSQRKRSEEARHKANERLDLQVGKQAAELQEARSQI